MGSFSTEGNFREKAGKVSVDPQLMDILQSAAAASGLNVIAFSGVAPRGSGTKNHPGGFAVDLELQDPATGQTYSSYAGKPGSIGWKQSFPVYEQFAQTARVIQQAKYPDLNDTFAWGGYWFTGKGNKSGPDMMHFQVTPGKGNMEHIRKGIGGSWETGASKLFAETYGVTSNGGLATANGQRLSKAVQQSIAGGGPVPPASIPDATVFPATMTAEMAAERTGGAPKSTDLHSAMMAWADPSKAQGKVRDASFGLDLPDVDELSPGADGTAFYDERSGAMRPMGFDPRAMTFGDRSEAGPGAGSLLDDRTATLLRA